MAKCAAVVHALSACVPIVCAISRLSGRSSVSSMRRSAGRHGCPPPAPRGARTCRQHTARERAVRHHAKPEMSRGRELLDLGLAVHRVVVGLATTGRSMPASSQSRQISAMRQDGSWIRRNSGSCPPAPGRPARAPSLQRRPVVFLVQVQDVDEVGAEPPAGWPRPPASPICATGRPHSGPRPSGWRSWSPGPRHGGWRRWPRRPPPRTGRHYSHRRCR